MIFLSTAVHDKKGSQVEASFSSRRVVTRFGIVLVHVVLALAIILPASGQVTPTKQGIPGDLEQFIPAQMKNWKVPGLAIAVVQNGSVIYSHGFGLRDVKGNLPVTSKTIFAIGSISKSVTSLSMGISTMRASSIGISRCGNIFRSSRCTTPLPASA